MIIKTRLLLLSTACLLTLSACNSDQKTASGTTAGKTASGTTAATVNGTAISNERVDLLVKQRASSGEAASPEMRKAIIDQLSMQLIVSQEAVKKGMDKNTEVLDQIDLTRQSILAKAYIQDYIKTHPVTEEMLKADFDKIKAQATNSEYKASHILVNSETEAREIIAKLNKNPKAFAALATEKSLDSGSKVKGGELGWFNPHGMVPEFGAAIAKLSKGKFTEEPVKTRFGYHIILLEDSRVMPLPSFDQIKPQLTQQVQEQQLKTLIDDLKTHAKIDIAAASAVPATAK